MDDLMGEVLRSGSLPGRLMVLSADERSTLTATPDLEAVGGGVLLNSIGLEALFFIMLMGCVLNEGCVGRVLERVFLMDM